MKLEKYIKEILIEKGSAAVPGFGIFEKITTPASINKETGVMKPPRPDIIFNNKDKVISDALVKEIAKKEGLYENKIAEELKKQVDTWLHDLNTGKTITIDKLGTLKKEAGNQIVFKSNIDVSEFPDFYGLPTISVAAKGAIVKNKQTAKPIVGKTEKTKIKEKPKKKPVKPRPKPKPKKVVSKKEPKVKTEEERKRDKRRLILALLLIPIIALIVLAIWKFDYVSQKANSVVEYFSDNKNASKKDSVNKTETVAAIDTIKPVKTKQDTLAEERAKNEEVLGNYTIIDSKTNNKVTPKMEEFDSAKRIHIIAGSFARKVNARKVRRKLKKLGFNNVKILPLNNNLYRVSVESYEKVEEAVKNLEVIKAKDSATDFWILLDK